MTCERCGRRLRKTRRDYRYLESGLPNVILPKIPVYICPRHGVQAVVLRGIDRIHADIARALLERGTPLTGAEIRFLRRYHEWNQGELAQRLGVHKITVAKWETGAVAVGPANQQRVRLLFTDPVTFQKLQVSRRVQGKRPAPLLRIPVPRTRARDHRAVA